MNLTLFKALLVVVFIHFTFILLFLFLTPPYSSELVPTNFGIAPNSTEMELSLLKSISTRFDLINYSCEDIGSSYYPLQPVDEVNTVYEEKYNEFVLKNQKDLQYFCSLQRERIHKYFYEHNVSDVRIFSKTDRTWKQHLFNIPRQVPCSVSCFISDDLMESDVVFFNKHVKKVINLSDEVWVGDWRMIEYPNNIINYDDIEYRSNLFQVRVGIEKFADVPLFYVPYCMIRRDNYKLNSYGYYFLDSDDVYVSHIDLVRDKGEMEYRKRLSVNIDKKSKESLGATFISNCNTQLRNDYLSRLEEFITIHSYGLCGKNRIIEKNNDNTLSAMYVNKIQISNKYKFSFCFENSIYFNYVTEKIYNCLSAIYTVPIYFGAPNIYSYFPKKVVEKYKLFIFANEFPNPDDLADYLLYLNANHTAYLEYFQWRLDNVDLECVFKYGGDNPSEQIDNALCEVCKLYKFGKKYWL